MLNKIVKQQKKQLLTLMLKNEVAEMWLTKKIAETPEEIKELDIEKIEKTDKKIEEVRNKLGDKDNTIYINEKIKSFEEQKEQYDKYIDYMTKLDNILKAKKDNLFNLKYIDKASKKVKKYV